MKIEDIIKLVCSCITAVCSVIAGTYIGIKNQKQFNYWASQEKKNQDKPEKGESEDKNDPKSEDKNDPKSEEVQQNKK